MKLGRVLVKNFIFHWSVTLSRVLDLVLVKLRDEFCSKFFVGVQVLAKSWIFLVKLG